MSETTSRTSAATEARMRARDDRYAERLRSRGQVVVESEALDPLLAADRCDVLGCSCCGTLAAVRDLLGYSGE